MAAIILPLALGGCVTYPADTVYTEPAYAGVYTDPGYSYGYSGYYPYYPYSTYGYPQTYYSAPSATFNFGWGGGWNRHWGGGYRSHDWSGGWHYPSDGARWRVDRPQYRLPNPAPHPAPHGDRRDWHR